MVMGYDLLATLQAQAEYAGFYKSIPPMACPFDGIPLLLGPPGQPATLYCPHGNYYYPRDYDQERDQGM